MFSSKPKMDIREVQTIVEGLKKLYKLKMKPLEEHYLYHEFHSPFLQDSDFEAKPMVLLLGQYSTGKTTFISFLIDREFPGSHIGPEPTTGACQSQPFVCILIVLGQIASSPSWAARRIASRQAMVRRHVWRFSLAHPKKNQISKTQRSPCSRTSRSAAWSSLGRAF